MTRQACQYRVSSHFAAGATRNRMYKAELGRQVEPEIIVAASFGPHLALTDGVSVSLAITFRNSQHHFEQQLRSVMQIL